MLAHGDVFDFDNIGNSFSNNDIIFIMPDVAKHIIYDIIRKYDKLQVSVTNTRHMCHICNNYILENQEIFSFRSVRLHKECKNTLTRIINRQPIANIKLNFNNNCDILPIYGNFNNNLIAYRGTFIEVWCIDSMLNELDTNIYTALTLINDSKSNAGDGTYCQSCQKTVSIKYKILNDYYCIRCGEKFFQFKNKLINKFMLLNLLVVKDITVLIIHNIINMFVV